LVSVVDVGDDDIDGTTNDNTWFWQVFEIYAFFLFKNN
jgi:hypothetical protein